MEDTVNNRKDRAELGVARAAKADDFAFDAIFLICELE